MTGERTLPRMERGVIGFREEKSRAQGWAAAVSLVMLAFLVLMAQVWISTEVTEAKARVATAKRLSAKLDVDLAVARAELQRSETYGALRDVAAEEGLVPDAPRQHIALSLSDEPALAAVEAPAEPRPVWASLVHGTRLMWSEANATERPRKGVPHGSRR